MATEKHCSAAKGEAELWQGRQQWQHRGQKCREGRDTPAAAVTRIQSSATWKGEEQDCSGNREAGRKHEGREGARLRTAVVTTVAMGTKKMWCGERRGKTEMVGKVQSSEERSKTAVAMAVAMKGKTAP